MSSSQSKPISKIIALQYGHSNKQLDQAQYFYTPIECMPKLENDDECDINLESKLKRQKQQKQQIQNSLTSRSQHLELRNNSLNTLNQHQNVQSNKFESPIQQNRYSMIFSDSDCSSPSSSPSPSSYINKKKTRKRKKINNHNIDQRKNKRRKLNKDKENKCISPLSLSSKEKINPNKPLKRRTFFRRKKSLFHSKEDGKNIPTNTIISSSSYCLRSLPSKSNKNTNNKENMDNKENIDNKENVCCNGGTTNVTRIPSLEPLKVNSVGNYNKNINNHNNNNNHRRHSSQKKMVKRNRNKKLKKNRSKNKQKREISPKMKWEVMDLEEDDDLYEYIANIRNKNNKKSNTENKIYDNINGINIHEFNPLKLSQRTRRACKIRKKYNENMKKEYNNLQKTSMITRDGESVDVICLD